MHYHGGSQKQRNWHSNGQPKIKPDGFLRVVIKHGGFSEKVVVARHNVTSTLIPAIFLDLVKEVCAVAPINASVKFNQKPEVKEKKNLSSRGIEP